MLPSSFGEPYPDWQDQRGVRVRRTSKCPRVGRPGRGRRTPDTSEVDPDAAIAAEVAGRVDPWSSELTRKHDEVAREMHGTA